MHRHELLPAPDQGLGHGHSGICRWCAHRTCWACTFEPGVLPLPLGSPVFRCRRFSCSRRPRRGASRPAGGVSLCGQVAIDDTLCRPRFPSAQGPATAGLLAALCALIHPIGDGDTLHDFTGDPAWTPPLFVIRLAGGGCAPPSVLGWSFGLVVPRRQCAASLVCLLFAIAAVSAALVASHGVDFGRTVSALLRGVYLLVHSAALCTRRGLVSSALRSHCGGAGTPDQIEPRSGARRPAPTAAHARLFATAPIVCCIPGCPSFRSHFLAAVAAAARRCARRSWVINFLSGFPGVLRPSESHIRRPSCRLSPARGSWERGVGNFSVTPRGGLIGCAGAAWLSCFSVGLAPTSLHGGSPLALLSTRFAWRDFIDGQEALGCVVRSPPCCPLPDRCARPPRPPGRAPRP